MSSMDDVSSLIGEYMLKGWVLTDRTCTTSGCTVPLMRSPSGRQPVSFFCARCDESPGVPRSKPMTNVSDSSSSTESDSRSPRSRTSTPHTEVSSTLSSPLFAPPPETTDSRRRREQSDRASTEIGQRLLKGWVMLGEECPNLSCYGVPLVRRPKAGGERDPRKECVICGSVYTTEVDQTGMERLMPVVLSGNATFRSNLLTPANGIDNHSETQILEATPSAITRAPGIQAQPETAQMVGSHLPVLDETSQALQYTLHTLSGRLTLLSRSHVSIDPASIGLTADAITKVTQALAHVQRLQECRSGS